MRRNNHQSGFALVTGLIMLLMLTLIAITVMRGTKLELAMTTAVTRQEQAFSLADSARSLGRELLFSALQVGVEGEATTTAVAGRAPNLPSYFGSSSTCPGVGNMADRFGRQGANTTSFTQIGINAFDNNVMSLRVQTVNASPAHITPIVSTKPAGCDVGTMYMGIIEMTKKIEVGSDVANPEVTKAVALIGYGDTVDGGYAKVLTVSDVQINNN